MKTWLSVFSAVLTAGVGIVIFAQWRAATTSEEQERWRFEVRSLVMQASDEARSQPGPNSAASVSRMRERGQELKRTKPSGAFDASLDDALAQLSHRANYLRSVDWKEVHDWTEAAKSIVPKLRTALKNDNWDDAITAARDQVGRLLKTVPKGADASILQGAIAEISRAVESLDRTRSR